MNVLNAVLKLKISVNLKLYETVQLYLKDIEASVEVPKWELKGINNIYLKSVKKKK